MSDLVFASACQLAQMIREQQVSAVEALDAYLAQIAKHNSKLNAICILNIISAASMASSQRIAESLPQDISLKFPVHLAVYVKC